MVDCWRNPGPHGRCEDSSLLHPQNLPVTHKKNLRGGIMAVTCSNDDPWWILLLHNTSNYCTCTQACGMTDELSQSKNTIQNSKKECIKKYPRNKNPQEWLSMINRIICLDNVATNCLGPLSPYPTGQLDVFGHDGDTFGVDGAQVCVLKQTHQVSLTGFLFKK